MFRESDLKEVAAETNPNAKHDKEARTRERVLAWIRDMRVDLHTRRRRCLARVGTGSALPQPTDRLRVVSAAYPEHLAVGAPL